MNDPKTRMVNEHCLLEHYWIQHFKNENVLRINEELRGEDKKRKQQQETTTVTSIQSANEMNV